MRKILAGVAAAVIATAPVIISTASAAHATTAQLPCDIYASDGHPCVAANSTTRALFAAYNGPLYTVTRAFDGSTLTIDTAYAGGPANVAPQDSFCEGTTCTITDIADQTSYNNDLIPAGAGGNGSADVAAIANVIPMTVEGYKVYGVDVQPGVGYMDDDTYMIPTGGAAQGAYMVTSGLNYNYGCCFDYGNAETNRDDNGDGHMFAPSYGGGGGIGVDVENNIIDMSPNLTSNFVDAFASTNGTSSYTLEEGNGQSGSLTTHTASLPTGWHPLHTEDSMVLGTGGDNSKTASGDWMEGVMTSGQPSTTADAAVQAEIVAAGYTF